MLTIDDIKNVGFRRAKFGGYKPEDVDAFIDDVQISFEKMSREIKKLSDTVRNLNSQVRKFKEEDESIKGVISSAKQVAEKSIDDAKNHTTNMLSEAARKSEDMINSAKKEVEINREISERLKSESAKLRQKLDEIYKRHLEIISEIPADVFASESLVDDKKHEKSEARGDNNSGFDGSNARKRFFEIDANHAKESSNKSRVSDGDSKEGFTKDFFSSDDRAAARSRSKFQNLQFGKNFDITSSGTSSEGAYSGIFKKD